MAKIIMDNVIVYAITSQRNNNFKGDCVYLNKEHAEKARENYMYSGYETYLQPISLPFAGKHASYISIYKGYDYGINNMYDIIYNSSLFSSVSLAKQDDAWQEIVQMMENNLEKFNVYYNKICSKDTFGEDWIYGDVMEGKVSAEIKKLKIIR